MKKTKLFSLPLLLSLFACTAQDKTETEALRQELAALKSEYEAQRVAYEEMDSLLMQVNTLLDSVVFAGNKLQSERRRIKKNELPERIAAIENYMKQAEEKIVQAQQQAERYKLKAAGLAKTLERFKAELALQEEKIARLEAELNNTRAEIARLQTANIRKDSLLTVQEETIRNRREELNRSEEARRAAELQTVKIRIEQLLLQGDEDLEDAGKIWFAIGKNNKRQQLLRQADKSYREALALYDAHRPPGIDRKTIEQKINAVAAKMKTPRQTDR